MAEPATTAYRADTEEEVDPRVVENAAELRRRRAAEYAEARASSPAPAASAFDPDVLLFALPLAAGLDIWGVISIFISLGILGFLVSLVLGIPLVIWIVVKEGAVEDAGERMRERMEALRDPRRAKKRAARRVARKLLRKGIRKFFVKLIIGSILVFFPYWLWSVISVLRKR